MHKVVGEFNLDVQGPSKQNVIENGWRFMMQKNTITEQEWELLHQETLTLNPPSPHRRRGESWVPGGFVTYNQKVRTFTKCTKSQHGLG